MKGSRINGREALGFRLEWWSHEEESGLGGVREGGKEGI